MFEICPWYQNNSSEVSCKAVIVRIHEIVSASIPADTAMIAHPIPIGIGIMARTRADSKHAYRSCFLYKS